MRRTSKSIILNISAMMMVSGCLSFEDETVQNEIQVVTPRTLAGRAPQPSEGEQVSPLNSLKFSMSVLDSRKIVRPRVELRDGPGAGYFIDDVVLEKGDLVIVLERYFRWRKILALKGEVTGWVHEKTLSERNIADGENEIKLEIFPKIFTRDKITRIYDYETSKLIPYDIPKGKSLKKLKQVKGRILILLEGTNSVAWINEGDVI